ncbi:MAG TPA: hypothetical protein VGL86_12545 [Polyangia bacterium]
MAIVGCAAPGEKGGGGAVDLGAGGGSDDGGTGGNGAGDLAAAPDQAGAAECSDGDAYCKSWNVVTACVGGAWVDQTCVGGCSAGACSASACADECALGDTSSMGTCELWSVAAGAFVAPDVVASMHDRARDYDRLRRQKQLVQGAVCNAEYSDATRATLSFYSGTGDAALWTGTSLAAEAWRYRATGAPDAADEIARLGGTLHRLFDVSGEPAYLARLAVPTGDTTPLETANRCVNNADWHCATSYGGGSWDWLGHTSRDAYTGVMLGYDAAYAVTRDDSVRAAIRADVVALATELMKQRMVPATVTVEGVPIPKTLALSNVVLAPAEMTNGRVTITVGGDDELYGAREFIPDFGPVLSQITGVSPPVPRPGSAMMLGAFFSMALTMTDGVDAATHQTLLDYYNANADAWLDVAAQWSFSANCGSGYYANHIAYIMAYVWARLEKDPTRGARIADAILDGEMWKALDWQKNPYFAFLWGATRTTTPDAATIAAANAELAQFPPGPRVHVAVDQSTNAKYLPHDTSCTSTPMTDTANDAVDVGDRVIEDFLWQRDPWELLDAGNAAEVYPGVDYLAAYWAARAAGFASDDAPGTCARWAP